MGKKLNRKHLPKIRTAIETATCWTKVKFSGQQFTKSPDENETTCAC